MNASPLISVITAVRDGADYLAETIASVQAQTISDWEYIIVDDDSRDQTPHIIQRAAEVDRRILYVRRHHAGGPYVAANDALAICRGSFVFRIDSDDLSPANRFERQLAFLAENPALKACISFWRPLGRHGLGPLATLPTLPGVLRWYWVLRSATVHSSACIARSALQEIGGYASLPLAQDYRLWCELTLRGWLGVIPEPLSFVRRHPKCQSFERAQLQRQLALDVLGDYLRALTSIEWAREDLEDLFRVGHSERMDIHRGIDMLHLWEQLWRADLCLTQPERSQLAHLAAMRRWKHLRANARTQPLHAVAEALKQGMLHPLSFTEAWRAAS